MMKIISLILLIVGFTGGRFESDLHRYLESKLSSYHSFDYEVIQMPKANKVKILFEKEININGNLAYVPVEICDNNNFTSNSYISIKLKLLDNVLVAKEDLDYKEKLNSTMFEKKIKDVSRLRGTPLVDIGEVSKFRSNRKLNAGQILVYENLEKIPDVVSGAVLNAFSTAGNVAVSTKAFAREDGKIGETIKVRTVDNKIFVAKIIDSLQVIILE